MLSWFTWALSSPTVSRPSRSFRRSSKALCCSSKKTVCPLGRGDGMYTSSGRYLPEMVTPHRHGRLLDTTQTSRRAILGLFYSQMRPPACSGLTASARETSHSPSVASMLGSPGCPWRSLLAAIDQYFILSIHTTLLPQFIGLLFRTAAHATSRRLAWDEVVFSLADGLLPAPAAVDLITTLCSLLCVANCCLTRLPDPGCTATAVVLGL